MKRPLIQHGAELHRNVSRGLFLSVTAAAVIEGIPYEGIVVGNAEADEPIVFWTIKPDALPGGLVSFTKCEAVWATEAAAGNMYWQITAAYGAEGETVDIHTDSPARGATAAGGANIINVQEPANPLTLASLAPGDYLTIRFERNGTDVLDTLDDAMYLLGLLFTYVAAQ